MYFAVLRQPGPASDVARPMREQDAWLEHAAFMDGLAEEGLVVLGGPVGDGSRFLFLVKAESEAQIRAQVAADPWAAASRLSLVSIEPWDLLLGAPAP